MTEGKKFLTRDLILKALDLPTQEVEVPEWGGVVMIRAMTGAERDAFEASMLVEKEGDDRRERMINVRARLCASVIVAEDGVTALFTTDDVKQLGGKSAKALNRVFEAARKLSGFTDTDVKELEGK
jgi:hypothetical protein